MQIPRLSSRGLLASAAALLAACSGSVSSGDPQDVGGGGGTGSSTFWDASNVPAAKNVMTFKFLNRTNGKLRDDQIYWRFQSGSISELHSIAAQSTYDMPANSSGRMYFFLCVDASDCATDPSRSPYYDFIEFTIGGAPPRFNGNTTRVDAFGIKLAMRLNSPDGDDTVGEDEATFQEDRQATFNRFIAETPAEFAHLAQAPFAPHRIVEPGAGQFKVGGTDQHYADGWVDQLWASNGITVAKPTANCNPIANPDLSAACHRHVGLGAFNTDGTIKQGNTLWKDSAQFYPSAPANFYARFWHAHAIAGRAYGFPYDDVGGYSSYISHANPKYLLVAIGW